MPERTWSFWIDVGGTFTDCIAQAPDGALRTMKLLSSGAIKRQVRAVEDETTQLRFDRADWPEPEGFFEGYELRALDHDGAVAATRRIVRHDAEAGRIETDAPLPPELRRTSEVELTACESAPVLGVRKLLGLKLDDDPGDIRVRLGTTRATNALLQRNGARVGLVTTRGFADLLEIGTQARPELFKLHIEKPPPLHETVIEADERIAADGEILTPLDEPALRRGLEALREAGIDAIAICLINAYANDAHEKRAADLARDAGFDQVSVSSQLSPTIKAPSTASRSPIRSPISPPTPLSAFSKTGWH